MYTRTAFISAVMIVIVGCGAPAESADAKSAPPIAQKAVDAPLVADSCYRRGDDPDAPERSVAEPLFPR